MFEVGKRLFKIFLFLPEARRRKAFKKLISYEQDKVYERSFFKRLKAEKGGEITIEINDLRYKQTTRVTLF